MPFKSKSQQKYMHWLKDNNQLPKSIDLDEYDAKTDSKHLPEKAAVTKFKKLKSMLGKK